MKISHIFHGVILLFCLLVFSAPLRAQEVVELDLDDVIHSISAEYLTQGIDYANAHRSTAVLIRLSTPGGLDGAMRKIIERIITSRVPVIVFVAPSGSRAASAGFFILMSADWAVMAPGTNTGAAHPVLIGGGAVNDTMEKKVVSDAAAYLRSLVSKRGHNVELAETAVTESKSFTEKEAIDQHLIDQVAASPGEIFSLLDRKTIKLFDGSELTLDLARAVEKPLGMTARQRFLSSILDPNIAFLLGVIGLLGIYLEFTHPGLIFPGVAGALALVLALFAFHLLPINFTGVVLLILAVTLFLLEAKFVSHGILALGGVLAMVIGALILVESPLPALQIHLSTALGVAIPFALITVFLLRLVIRARKARVTTGVSAMIGAKGVVRTAINGEAQILVQGELWRATSQEELMPGTEVVVTRVNGLTLEVESVRKDHPQ